LSRRNILLVVSDPRDAAGLPDEMVVRADQFVESADEYTDPRTLVVNLCRSYRYGTKGYYVSLLADARGQQVLPSIETSAGLAEPYTLFRALQEAGVPTIDAAEMAIRRRALDLPHPAEPSVAEQESDAAAPGFPPAIVRIGGDAADADYRLATRDEIVEVLLVLGQSPDTRFRQAARAIFREWPAPLLRLQFVLEDGEWMVAQVAPVAPHRLDDAGRRLFVEAFADRQRVLRRGRDLGRETVRASIAVLVDPNDPFSPSSPETIDRLERVALRMNVHVARLGLGELRKLPEYDALFIRSYAAVTHPSFQFALRAEALDMPVIDDTQSTIRCTNKVFIEELLRREGVPTPKALILTEHAAWPRIEELGLPFVIKLPDGSFSAAVHKVGSREEYERHARAMFRESPLLIAQEWLPTDFDWRITVLGGELLFAARYYMARGHWQIRSVVKGAERYGKVEAVRRADAPKPVVEAALRAARLVGNGLYGVDLKETPRGPVVIEVNDNPNLDTGYDDAVDGDAIYEDLVRWFVTRVEEAGGVTAGAPGAAGASAQRGARGRASSAVTGGAAAPGPDTEPERQRRQGRAHVSTSIVRQYGLFEVAGIELEYPTVNAQLDVVPLVEQAFRLLAGRGTSDVELGPIAFSNEFADHVFEIKTVEPVRALPDAEAALHEGIERFAAALRDEYDARLMPTAMHPWFDPVDGRLWTRSGLRVYTTYARLFDVRTHGWMNVQASHVNLPFGDERETMAMLAASSLLIPYLPAVAASSPIHDGVLQEHLDARLTWLSVLQARVPESCGAVVPEFVASFADYRKRILQPMYAALDRLPHAGAIRHEFFNARGAILRFRRRALEIRVLDTQECVKMDVAIAAFVRAALRDITRALLAGDITLPPHEQLVADFQACIRDGARARVIAPHFAIERGDDGRGDARSVLRHVLEGAHRAARDDEQDYLALVADVIEAGPLAEQIRARLQPHAGKRDAAFRNEVRTVYSELIECLETNRPWSGRGLGGGTSDDRAGEVEAGAAADR
jgi:glutathione synthase/RimK-type ligase-like ATP-grasp enzyme/gamma-glutamyl:cysteine ligase YbdK (ATP-grasp superfamily)